VPDYRQLAVNALTLCADNPRRGRVDQIAESLTKHGQYRPLVVNAGTHTGRPNEVLAGNHTLIAARNLGWNAVDVAVIDVDDAMAHSIIAADNRLADLGEYDDESLVALLTSLDDLTGTGYTAEDLAKLLAINDPAPEPEEFPSYNEDLETEYECPKCHYQWSGSPN
jgi:ParB-like chromosome segregation protein Spo0J